MVDKTTLKEKIYGENNGLRSPVSYLASVPGMGVRVV